MNIYEAIATFAIGYPSLMASVWICGGVYYYFHWERKQRRTTGAADAPDAPWVTVLVPCHNEGRNVDETIGHLFRQRYLNLDIIAINDGSHDDTGKRLDALALHHPGLTVIHQDNQGKASALNHGLAHAAGEIILCIDGDAALDDEAVSWMLEHFICSPRVGGVTGNPRVRTRSTAIGKIQTGEFSSIIGLIKRAQRIYGIVFTVSGVVCSFRRQALEQVGGWSTDMVTEDIDISWKLQLAGWQVRYEPRALCWVLMPETLRGLFRQRLRWAQGGAEVFLRYFTQAVHWKHRRFWALLIEYTISVAWCYSILALILLSAANLLMTVPGWETIDDVLSWFSGPLIAFCLLQFCISFLIDSRYDRSMIHCLYWSIWYPVFYWLLNMVTVTLAFPKAALRRRGRPAIWSSPDRGESFREE
jgi:biofilm PGA synthesis N-glycosyltransferase PgaC